MDRVAGVFFLSTPHRFGDRKSTLNRFRCIYGSASGEYFRITRENIELEATIIFDLAARFEALSLQIPVFSSFELLQTKICYSTTQLSKYSQLVDRETCSTHVPLETIVGLNVNHHDACIFTRSLCGGGLKMLNQFAKETFSDASQLVQFRFEARRNQHTTTSTYPPKSGREIDIPEFTKSPSGHIIEEAPKVQGYQTLNLPCFLVYPANVDFCGREDILERIAAELLPSKEPATAANSTLRQFALCGFGGIGWNCSVRCGIHVHYRSGILDTTRW